MSTLTQARRTLREHCIQRVNFSRVCATVNGFEAKTKPRHNNIHAAVTVGRGRAAPEHSSLAASAFRQIILIRIQHRVVKGGTEHQETLIENRLADGTATIIDAFHKDISVTDTIEFDPLGSDGLVLETVPGYVDYEADGSTFRIETTSLPFIIYDIWSQTR